MTLTSFLATIFCLSYYIISQIELLPQIIKLLKTKKSDDFSKVSTIMGVIGCTCWTSYIFLTEQTIIARVGTVLDQVAVTVETILILKYMKNTENT